MRIETNSEAPMWILEYKDAGIELENLGGVSWADAEQPPRFHRCRAQTRGWDMLTRIQRCACGAIRLGRDKRWSERNSR